ncbi:MAG: type II secretion system protein [Candidatus Aminicenantes bacterium]|nr:type II secretion system protein [Candidatus Aminicenantes bacterium]
MTSRPSGYVLIILLFLITSMAIGLMVAVPVWQTQIQREKEEELIFRGNQYVEAVRIYQLKKPGAFPRSLDELVEEKCIRRLYEDPMSPDGAWKIILLPVEPAPSGRPQTSRAPARTGTPNPGRERAFSAQVVLVAPQAALSSIRNAQILGVVSSSTQKSFRVYHSEESYDRWLFFYGYDPENPPEIRYHGDSSR